MSSAGRARNTQGFCRVVWVPPERLNLSWLVSVGGGAAARLLAGVGGGLCVSRQQLRVSPGKNLFPHCIETELWFVKRSFWPSGVAQNLPVTR